MPFGLSNAAQTFQRFIDTVLRGLNFCYAYLDDILVASQDEKEHREHLEQLFAIRLDQYGMVVNPTKCVFAKSEIIFLGYTVDENGTKPLAEKIKAILDFPKPDTVRQLRRFLGMMNFYRRFIPKTANMQAPLKLLKGRKLEHNAPIQWFAEADTAFQALKDVLLNAALLAHPSNRANLAIMVDASDFAIGATLQQQEEGAW